MSETTTTGQTDAAPAAGAPTVLVEEVSVLSAADLQDLCDAAESAIKAGGGFGWIDPPPLDLLEAYWRGVLMIPERVLLAGRLDGVIAGSCQIVRPPRNNEAQKRSCQITTNFVAPWARGHGLSAALLDGAEARARELGFLVINLDVRVAQHAAIRLYERSGYHRFGTHPRYAWVKDHWVAGHFYFKALDSSAPDEAAETGP